MTFNLIMKRKVFARVQDLCDEYEDSFKEKLPTATLINVLLAEAMINRGLIPQDFIKNEYGSKNPLAEGFTAFSRKEKATSLPQLREMEETEKQTRYFSAILAGEWAAHPSEKWRNAVCLLADKWKDKIPQAAYVLDLGKQEIKHA